MEKLTDEEIMKIRKVLAKKLGHQVHYIDWPTQLAFARVIEDELFLKFYGLGPEDLKTDGALGEGADR